MNNVLTFNTLSESQDRLMAAFNCLDSNKAYLFSGIQTRLLPIVEKYFEQLGNVTTTPDMTVWYHIPKEQALAFDTKPPEGISLAPLRQEDVDTINSIWPHRAPKSEIFVGYLISKNMTLGAYDKEGNIRAWIFQLPVGSLGILHVKDEHKRKGYGSLMVRVMSKMFAEKGIEVTAPVVHTNTPSRDMFKKLNFKEIDQVYWWRKPAIE